MPLTASVFMCDLGKIVRNLNDNGAMQPFSRLRYGESELLPISPCNTFDVT